MNKKGKKTNKPLLKIDKKKNIKGTQRPSYIERQDIRFGQSLTSLVRQLDFCAGTSCFPSKPKEIVIAAVYYGFDKERKN